MRVFSSTLHAVPVNVVIQGKLDRSASENRRPFPADPKAMGQPAGRDGIARPLAKPVDSLWMACERPFASHDQRLVAKQRTKRRLH